MSYVYVVTLWVHTGDTNTQPGSGDTWSHVMTAASPTHVTWAAGAGPGRLLPASAWWSESLSAPYTTLPSGWPGHSEALHRARHQHHHSTGQHTSTSTYNNSLAHSPTVFTVRTSAVLHLNLPSPPRPRGT